MLKNLHLRIRHLLANMNFFLIFKTTNHLIFRYIRGHSKD
jgi:hypothetical protein